jgi:uncharacterized protein YodC (DUF2158 family)
MTKLKIGDVVRLRHGGPVMTVLGYQKSDGFMCDVGWRCCWHVQGALRIDVFPARALQPATSEVQPGQAPPTSSSPSSEIAAPPATSPSLDQE